VGDHPGRPRVVHHLAEQRPEHEQRKELGQVLSELGHEHLRVGAQQQRRRASADQDRDHRHDRGQQQHVDAAIGKKHQSRKGKANTEDCARGHPSPPCLVDLLPGGVRRHLERADAFARPRMHGVR